MIGPGNGNTLGNRRYRACKILQNLRLSLWSHTVRLDAMDGSLERDVLLRKRLVRVVDPPTVCGKLELFIFREKWGIAQRLRLQVCVCVCVCVTIKTWTNPNYNSYS